MTVRVLRGISREIILQMCCRAPRTTSLSGTVRVLPPQEVWRSVGRLGPRITFNEEEGSAGSRKGGVVRGFWRKARDFRLAEKNFPLEEQVQDNSSRNGPRGGCRTSSVNDAW